jgi:hypothetical protein
VLVVDLELLKLVLDEMDTRGLLVEVAMPVTDEEGDGTIDEDGLLVEIALEREVEVKVLGFEIAGDTDESVLEEDVDVEALLGTNLALINNCKLVREIGTDKLAAGIVLEEGLEKWVSGPEITCDIDDMVI